MFKKLRRHLAQKSFFRGCYLFYKNMIFLTQYHVKDAARMYDIEFLRHELAAELPHTQNPRIKSVDETLDMLIHTQNSLCRFGDGEFENALQIPTGFQYTTLPEISKRLLEVLASRQPNICIGLPLKLYHGKEEMPLREQFFWRNPNFKAFYHLIETHCSMERDYYATEVSMPFSQPTINLENFFHKVRQIWDQKDITLIANKHIFEGLQYNIFDNVRSVEIMDAPRENAFAEYDTLLKRALKIDKTRLILIILGQTATVLAYDLARNGLRALDFGHIAKTYDWYKRNKLADTKNFYKPD